MPKLEALEKHEKAREQEKSIISKLLYLVLFTDLYSSFFLLAILLPRSNQELFS